VLSVRVVELRVLLSAVEHIEGAALKGTTSFLFSVDPNVVKREKINKFLPCCRPQNISYCSQK
jgi:hypothetical protein